jgi:hypothetical protein
MEPEFLDPIWLRNPERQSEKKALRHKAGEKWSTAAGRRRPPSSSSRRTLANSSPRSERVVFAWKLEAVEPAVLADLRLDATLTDRERIAAAKAQLRATVGEPRSDLLHVTAPVSMMSARTATSSEIPRAGVMSISGSK